MDSRGLPGSVQQCWLAGLLQCEQEMHSTHHEEYYQETWLDCSVHSRALLAGNCCYSQAAFQHANDFRYSSWRPAVNTVGITCVDPWKQLVHLPSLSSFSHQHNLMYATKNNSYTSSCLTNKTHSESSQLEFGYMDQLDADRILTIPFRSLRASRHVHALGKEDSWIGSRQLGELPILRLVEVPLVRS